MRLIKTIDLWVQTVIIPVCLIMAFLGDELMFAAYFIVGGWQMLSTIAHLLLRHRFIPLKARKYYTIIAFILVAGLPLFNSSTGIVIYYGFTMLIVSPFLALWYVYICFEEKKRLEHKELVHLK